LSRVRDKEDWNILTISAPPAFGARWLVPRIVDFRTANPQIQVRIDPAIRSMDPVRDSVDVAIEFSQGHYSGRSAQRLFGQDVFPVCSPELLSGKYPLTTPADLRGHTLIHFDAPMGDPEWPNWETWLRANNVDRLDPNKGPHFTSPNFTTQALLAGHGVALMAELVVESELATGTLVKPFDISYPGDQTPDFVFESVESFGCITSFSFNNQCCIIILHLNLLRKRHFHQVPTLVLQDSPNH
jgi:LysR family glycine cleavage system transcriptional activator